MLWKVIEKVVWSIRGSYQTIWSSPLQNAKWHFVAWLNTMTTLYRSDLLYTNPWPFYRTRPFTELSEVSIEPLRRMWHAHSGRLPLRIPGPIPLGTRIFSTCSDQFLSRTWRYFSELRARKFAKRVSLLFYYIFYFPMEDPFQPYFNIIFQCEW